MLATARKWRPQGFEEVVGQDDVVLALKNSIITGRIHHAYLFSGPRGVGKTTLARIVAKALNCEKGPTVSPCGKCENCVEIKEGKSIDVIEIDGASNRRIDDIRNIRESVKLVPVKSRYKIYIIDEVHMLTEEAFNALLKTLEEPPDHVVFIFATTEPFKVKQTIRSRCQHYILRPIPVSTIFYQLKKISQAENFKIPDSVLMKVAKAGNGSMRDAESIFDMVVSYFGDSVFSGELDRNLLKNLSNFLGVLDVDHLDKFLSFIVSKDIIGFMKFIQDMYLSGFSLRRFVEEMISSVRDLIMMISFGRETSFMYSTPDELEILEKYKDKISTQELLFIESVLFETLNQMRTTTNELLYLENLAFKVINSDNVITLSKVLDEIISLRKQINNINSYIPSPNTVEIENASGIKNSSQRIFDPADSLLEEIESSAEPSFYSEFIEFLESENLGMIENHILDVHKEGNILVILVATSARDIVQSFLKNNENTIREVFEVSEIRYITPDSEKKIKNSSETSLVTKPGNDEIKENVEKTSRKKENEIKSIIKSLFNAEEANFSRDKK